MRIQLAAWAACAALALPATAQDIVSFRSPTGNIHCLMFSYPQPGVRCDLRELVPSFPLRPAWCEADWGSAFEVLSTGPGAPVCAGDTVVMPDAPVLGYGQSLARWGLRCTSRETGMTCTNAEGHGFTLSRRSQKVF
ncbi:MAG: hypothetical protein N2Z62_15040 [Rhodobacteraceae bacterium]|nr:hypothetical protein [Paracoccaceae bacterium]